MTEITLDQVGCARCGSDGHPDITYTPLTFPIALADGNLATHWAPCPTNGEPILLATIRVPSVERRPDGWPLCPFCGEDELGDLNEIASADGDLFCYRCGRVTLRGGNPVAGTG